MSPHSVGSCFDKISVTGVEIYLRAQLHPADGDSIISSLKWKLSNLKYCLPHWAGSEMTKNNLLARLVMEMHHNSLHPGIVGVPRVLNIASVNLGNTYHHHHHHHTELIFLTSSP